MEENIFFGMQDVLIRKNKLIILGLFFFKVRNRFFFKKGVIYSLFNYASVLSGLDFSENNGKCSFV